MADLTVLSDAQVHALRHAVDHGIAPTIHRRRGSSIRTLQALARKNCVYLVYGPVIDPHTGRTYRSIVAGDVTVCGLRALTRAEALRRETAERESRARIPRQRETNPFDLHLGGARRAASHGGLPGQS